MSLEKRLPLALLTSFVVLFGWGLLQRPAPPVETGETSRSASSVAPSTDGPTPTEAAFFDAEPADDVAPEGAPEGAGTAVDARAAETAAAANAANASTNERPAAAASTVSAPRQDEVPAPAGTEPWHDWIELGQPGERGHVFAHFDSEGGSLRELRSGEYWIEQGLSAAARTQRANRTPILMPARFRDERGIVRTKGTLTLSPGPSAIGLAPADLAHVHWDHELLREDEQVVGVRFTYRAASGLVFEKVIRAAPDSHDFQVKLILRNEGARDPAGRAVSFDLTAAEAVPAETEDSFYIQPKAIAARVGKDPESLDRDPSGRKVDRSFLKSSKPGDLAYIGVHSKYFAVLLRPADGAAARTLEEATARAVFDGDFAAEHPDQIDEAFRYVAADAKLQLTVPQVGAELAWDYVLYAGPKIESHFTGDAEQFQQILRSDLGMFDGVASFILWLLRSLHGLFGNWGVAIIVLTLLVRGALFPLNRRMQTSMARHGTKMKRIQPKIDAIKERYKDEPKRLREEQAKIIQQEGAIPPLGGCLPLLIQIPIFFGLFSALRVAFDLRQQPFFGWIEDLSQPDRLTRLGVDLWVVNFEYLNLLPILMVVLWIGQQKVMPKPTEPQALQMHKMMMWMPIIFGLFLYEYAAGLSLYMITSSLFGIAEFTIIRKIWPLDDRELPKKKGGFLAKMAQLQEEAQRRQAQQQRGGGGKANRKGAANTKGAEKKKRPGDGGGKR